MLLCFLQNDKILFSHILKGLQTGRIYIYFKFLEVSQKSYFAPYGQTFCTKHMSFFLLMSDKPPAQLTNC